MFRGPAFAAGRASVRVRDMCFSAAASFTAGTSLAAIGAASVKTAPRLRDMPFAAIPLLFGVQQFAEGFVWLSLGHALPAWGGAAKFVFLFFSHVFWPLAVPLAVLCAEDDPQRRRVLRIFTAAGAAIAAYFLYYLLTESVQPRVLQGSISYVSPAFSAAYVISPYSVVICAGCLFSSHRFIRLFGAGVFLCSLVAFWIYRETFASVWCYFSALLSILVWLHIREVTRSAGGRRSAEP